MEIFNRLAKAIGANSNTRQFPITCDEAEKRGTYVLGRAFRSVNFLTVHKNCHVPKLITDLFGAPFTSTAFFDLKTAL